MLAVTRDAASTTALRYVLAIVLLTLACALGLTVIDSDLPGAAASGNGATASLSVATTGEAAQGPAAHPFDLADRADLAALSTAAGGASSGGHQDEGLVLLCLCALLVATMLLAAHRRPTRWLAASRRDTERPVVPVVGFPQRAQDPIDWGVSRT
ncbi:hypothetical protein [Isoptericola sp. NPDC019482]|uniref:hypothetical protein n=1 Tax=Isoptericola sp. NPDC019482 TaxID=3154688 RepID=UPI00347C4B7C